MAENHNAYQWALGKLSRMHHDEFADLLVAERLRSGLAPERPKLRCGTRSAYTNGCRCPRCKTAQADYWRRKRDRGIADDDPRHGALAGYQAGCRCTACRKAKREYNQELLRRKKSQGENSTAVGKA